MDVALYQIPSQKGQMMCLNVPDTINSTLTLSVISTFVISLETQADRGEGIKKISLTNIN